ncbi:MAG: hypothetical protein PHT69_15455, partial [Bacteroidales bacterium]|nr:hypothetical protein [Bacteroidales bacterium]
LARFAEDRGISPENITATMSEAGVFPHEAADVAMQAQKDGVARITMTWQEAFDKAEADINHSRNLIHSLVDQDYIEKPPIEMIEEAVKYTLEKLK